VELVFDPTPFKMVKYLSLASLTFFAPMLFGEYRLRREENPKP
jgi:hypothetical protein